MASLTAKPPSQPGFLTPNYSQPQQQQQQQQQQQPSLPRRLSSDTEHRHLLADDRSIAPSESASYLRGGREDEDPGERTPRAHSPAPSHQAASGPRRMTIGNPETASIADSEASSVDTTASRPYKGFPSEEAYLDALRAWAEERSYLQAGEHTLLGFYGNKTMQEYAAERPPELQGLGLRKKWKARKERKAGERDRAKSVA